MAAASPRYAAESNTSARSCSFKLKALNWIASQTLDTVLETAGSSVVCGPRFVRWLAGQNCGELLGCG